MNKSKGSIESEISKALTQWEKDYLGRGSVSVKTDILRDMVLVNLKGVLTPAEITLCESKEGMLSIKRTRSDLIESGIGKLKEIIKNITGEDIKSFHTDISTVTGERVMVFKVCQNLEERFEK